MNGLFGLVDQKEDEASGNLMEDELKRMKWLVYQLIESKVH